MRAKRRISRLAAIAFVCSLPLTTDGCGLLFTHAPPAGYEQMDYFTCTESNTGPILDIVWGGLNVLGALAAASDPSAYENSDQIVAVGLAWGALSGVSAGVGFNKTEKCRTAQQQLSERRANDRSGEMDEPADIVVQSVILTLDHDTLTVGERVQVVATAYNSSGAVIPNKMFSWSSSNDAIASVSNAGLVTAYATGAIVIAARTDNVVGTASIVVVSPR